MTTSVLPSERSMWRKYRIPVITLFLAWHFTAVLLWLAPDSNLKTILIQPFVGYLNYFELWQGWSVFEKPRLYNGYLTAVITYKDGTQKVWDFPRMEKLGFVEKMFKEKYRRWSNDCVSDESKPYLWPDAARYIARTNNIASSNPPITVSIVRHWMWIPTPDKGMDAPLPTKDDGSNILYTGNITPEDLI